MSTDGTWYLVEQLDSTATPTIVWRGDQTSDWTSLSRRTKREEGVDLTPLVQHAMTYPLESYEVREEGPLLDVPLEGHDDRHVVVHQVAGPDGETVFGLQLWVGPVGEHPTTKPRAAGVQWDPATGQIFNSPDTFMLSESNQDHYRDVRDVDQFFTKTLRFIDLEKLVALCTSPQVKPGDTMTSKVTLYHDAGHLVNLYFCAKRCPTDVRGIAQDITQWEQPTIDPATAMRITGSTPADRSSALLSFRDHPDGAVPAIAYWASDPPQWLPFWNLGPVDRQAVELIHPDDYGTLREARAEIDSNTDGGAAADVTVRLQGSSGNWVKVDATFSAYPAFPAPQRTLYVLQIPTF